jgi:hypothetical protein
MTRNACPEYSSVVTAPDQKEVPAVMTIRFGRWRLLLAAMAVFSLAVAAQEDRSFERLPNFHQVNENLYRGAQPQRGGLKKLSELGIKTIVNLRGASEDTRKEQGEAEASGMRYFNILCFAKTSSGLYFQSLPQAARRS